MWISDSHLILIIFQTNRPVLEYVIDFTPYGIDLQRTGLFIVNPLRSKGQVEAKAYGSHIGIVPRINPGSKYITT